MRSAGGAIIDGSEKQQAIEPGKGRRKRTFAVSAAKVIVFAVIIYFWYRYIKRNMGGISLGGWDTGWQTASFSALFIFAGYALRSFVWAPMRRELTGLPMPLSESFRVSALSWMGRYLPGKVWTVAGKAYLSSPDRNRIPVMGMAVVVDVLWFQLAGLVIAVLTMAVSGGSAIPPGWRLALGAALAAGLAVCHPGVFTAAANGMLRLMKKPELTHRPRYGVMLMVLAVDAATFILWGIGFYILASSMSDIGTASLPYITGLFSAAWVLGFFMVLVPAGIGVRESVLMFGLRGMGMADPLIIKSVIASRLLMTVMELVFFLAASVMSVARRRNQGAAKG